MGVIEYYSSFKKISFSSGVIRLREKLDREKQDKIDVVVTIQDESFRNIVPQHREITGKTIYSIYHPFIINLYFIRYSFAIFHQFFYYSSGCQRQRTTILELSVQFFSRWNCICWWYPLQLCRGSRPKHRPEWYREHNVWCQFIAWSLWRVRNQNTKCRSGTILHYLYFIIY